MENDNSQMTTLLKIKESDSMEIFVETLAHLIEVPAAFLALYDVDCIKIKATYGIKGLEEVCRKTKLWDEKTEEDFYIIEDLREANIPECKTCLTTVHGLNYYIAFPLGSKEKQRGFIAFLNKEKFLINAYQKKLLSFFTLILMDFLDLQDLLKEKLGSNNDVLQKLAHDLRNPLTVITLHTELLKMEDGLTEESIEMCNKIKESSKKIEALVRQSYI